MSWKRSEIPDHKFDYVDVDEFIDYSWTRRLLYSTVFIYAMKDILIYVADLASVVLLVASNSDVIFNKGGQGTIVFSPNFNATAAANGTATTTTTNSVIKALGGPLVLFFLIIASLLASFVLLLFEWRKATRIIKSRDISYAFTSSVAYNYYTIRSYAHYCFFSQIQNSRKPVDVLAFWVFFTFRGWKRLLLAEFVRQFLNSLIVFDIYKSQSKPNRPLLENIENVYTSQSSSLSTLVYLSIQLVTISLWVISFLGLFAAFIIYIPLLCNIRGNLKEYCVHKIDKRIDEILKRKTRKRLQDARKEEQERIRYGGSDMTLSTGVDKDQPTLPNIDIDLDDLSNIGSSYSHAQYYYDNGYNEYQDYVPSEVGSSAYGSNYYHQYYQQDVPPVPSQYTTSNSYALQDQRGRSYSSHYYDSYQHDSYQYGDGKE